jgi:hypothetical protein
MTVVDEPIPNRCVFVWVGPEFPFFARLAVESVLVVDAAATVEIHLCGTRQDGDHLRKLVRHDRVALHEVTPDSVFADVDTDPRPLRRLWDRIPARAASARSNLLRYALLYRRGGIYLDTDTLLLRSMRTLLDGPPFIGAELVWRVDEDRVRGRWRPWMLWPTVTWAASYVARRLDSRWCASRLGLDARAARLDRHWTVVAANNAVMGAPARDPFLHRLLVEAPKVDPSVRYALGPSLVTRLAHRATDVRVLEPDLLYAVPPSLSFRFFEDRRLALPERAHVMHYVGSNHRRLLSTLSPGEIRRRRDEGVFYSVAHRVLLEAG